MLQRAAHSSSTSIDNRQLSGGQKTMVSPLLTMEELGEFLAKLEFVEDPEAAYKSIVQVSDRYPMRVTKHVANRIVELQSLSLYRQFLPQAGELDDIDGAGAFFADEERIDQSIVKKYPNRCIVYLTNSCFSHCRHCSRKALWKEGFGFSKRAFDEDFRSLARLGVEEIVLTGGDAFAIGANNLRYVLDRLTRLEGVRVIRIATRCFTADPDVINEELCSVLGDYPSLVVMTQFNHPDEFSDDTRRAINDVQKTGCPVLNQSVLLKGVNDSVGTMRELLTCCAANRVIPYYLFHAFKVKGAQCFRTTPELGAQIIDDLVGNIGGWWIPKYTLIPAQTGTKVPVQPNGIIDASGSCFTLRDYRGRELTYE